MFELEGIELHMTEGAIDYIAEKAIEYSLGARGLRSICEAIMTDAMFDLPSNDKIKRFEVDLRYAREKLSRSKLKTLKAA
jgi:ATP-dependent Clp protease ATP-binding subunit ClpX